MTYNRSTVFPLALVWAALFLGPPVSHAQRVHQVVKDIYPGTTDSEPEGLTAWNGKVYFVANDGVHGFEPWMSDGTDAGTKMLKDINPGSGNGCDVSTIYLDNNFSNYFRPGAGGNLYFVANSGGSDTEVWITDGTEAGTTKLKDIAPGTAGSGPVYFKNLNNYTLFSVYINNQPALYRTDGTETGTISLAPIQLRNMYHAPVGNKLYFCADSSGLGSELFVTDGTSPGTHRVKDLNPGANSSGPTNLAALGNLIFFNADSGNVGRELWVSDGTPQGTRMVKDLYPGAGKQSNPAYLVAFQNKIFFSATDTSGKELWVSDGTRAGTQLFKNLYPTPGIGSDVFGLTVFNNQIWFCANSPTFTQSLWKSDGTVGGTVPLNQYSYGTHRVAGSYMYFLSKDGAINNSYLWVTDGNTLTKIPYYIPPGGGIFSNPFNSYEIMPVGNDVYTTGEFMSQVGYELAHVVTVTATQPLLSTSGELQLFPNPVLDWLYVKTTGATGKEEATVVDAMGKVVLKSTAAEKVDVSHLTPGLYSLKVGLHMQRFVKQ